MRRGPERIAARWLLALSAALALPAAADLPPAQREEVEYLLGFIAASDCTMIRNGTAYAAAEGARHVRRKYAHYREKILTTEAFIARAATRSLVTGHAYRVRCPGQPERPAADWLHDALAAYRAAPRDDG